MNTDERRHLEMMAATIAAGMEAWGDAENFNTPAEIAHRSVKRAMQIRDVVQELQTLKEQSGA
jgi:hypothetical protein